MLAGDQVFEALDVSEAPFLWEHEPVDVIVIAAEVDDPDVVEAQFTTSRSGWGPDATAKDLILELSKLLPEGTSICGCKHGYRAQSNRVCGYESSIQRGRLRERQYPH